MNSELVMAIVAPCVVPATEALKKILPKKIIPLVPIVIGLVANIVIAILRGEPVENVLLYGVSSGAIGSSLYDMFKAALK
jgi:hypothetical protein